MVVLRLNEEDAEAIAADIHRAALQLALMVDDIEAQGCAADLNLILRLFNQAIEGTLEDGVRLAGF